MQFKNDNICNLKIKYVGINLTKGEYDFYVILQNYVTERN